MRMGGDKVQEVVEEKSGVSDIRGAVRPLSRPPRHSLQRFQAAVPRHRATVTPAPFVRVVPRRSST